MKLPSIPYLSEALAGVLRRFPLVMLSAATGVVAAILLIGRLLKDYDENTTKVLLTASLGLTFLLCAAIAAEKWRLAGPKKWLPSLAALVLLALYFFTLDIGVDYPDATVMIRFVGLSLTAHLLVAYLPYLDDTPVEDFWEYNKQLFGHFMVGAFYSIVIYAGLAIAILAVDNLFNLHVNGNIYGYLFAVVAGIFNTSYFLANFPRGYEGLATEKSTYTTAIKNLSKFILIPIVGIYFLILYAYSAKILATWELPQGWVSSLVLGFSVAGIFTYLLNYLLVKFDDSGIVRGYRRWFFYILLPMVLLLFVGIGRRIGDYGVTEERYIVATAGVWLFLMALYFIISKKDNIKFIPLSLSVFALLTVLGPFSAFKVSERSQVGRLEAVFTKYNMIQDGKVSPPKDSLESADANDIYSILYYLRDHGHFAPVAPWFGLSPDVKSPEWEDLNKIITDLKINEQAGLSPGSNYCYAYFSQEAGASIAGFDTLYRVTAQPVSFRSSDGFSISASQRAIEWRKNGELVDSFDMLAYMEKLSGKYDCNQGEFKPEDAAAEVVGERYVARFISEGISFEKGEQLQMKDWNGMILLKKRQ